MSSEDKEETFSEYCFKIKYPNQSPCFLACMNGDIDKVKLEIENVDIHDNNESLLYIAVEKGHLNIVEFLVSKGADLEKADILRLACSRGHTHIVKWLADKIDLHQDNDIAFIQCCMSGNFYTAKYLFSIGADINSVSRLASPDINQRCSMALNATRVWNHPEMEQWLISLGAKDDKFQEI